MGLVAEPLLGLAKLLPKVRKVAAAEVLEFHPFQIVPNALVGIQLGGVSGELLQVNARRRPLCQKFLDHFAAMNRGSVPQDQQLAWDVSQQVLEKLDHIRPFIRPGL